MIKEDKFGVYTDPATKIQTPVQRFTLTNKNITIQVITYGAAITSIQVPDKNGTIGDIVTGFDHMTGYQSAINPYFGATIGRVANRTSGGKLVINGDHYQLTLNKGENHLHGGFKGFDKVLWTPKVENDKLTMRYISKDGEEGYPGEVTVDVSFELNDSNALLIDYKASTTKATPINLTNHSYFNLAGHNAGKEGLLEHIFQFNADQITETDNASVPTGKLLPVDGTAFDMRSPKKLADLFPEVSNGYDNNFCIKPDASNFVATALHPPSGRKVELYSNQPGVQFYTANFFPEGKGVLVGKNGTSYVKQGSFCLETQNYPNAVNLTNFPKAIYNTNETYHHWAKFVFTTE